MLSGMTRSVGCTIMSPKTQPSAHLHIQYEAEKMFLVKTKREPAFNSIVFTYWKEGPKALKKLVNITSTTGCINGTVRSFTGSDVTMRVQSNIV